MLIEENKWDVSLSKEGLMQRLIDLAASWQSQANHQSTTIEEGRTLDRCVHDLTELLNIRGGL